MCRMRSHAMPAVCAVLMAGGATGCSVHWTPPETLPAAADTTALGGQEELPLVAMWPGETRRVTLPVVVSTPTSPRVFVLRGDGGLTFRLRGSDAACVPVLQGMLPVVDAQGECVVRVDSLAAPGDTLSFRYTVSTTTNPPRFSRWHGRVVVETPLLVVNGFQPRDAVTVGPNPLNPQAMVQYVVTTPGRVTFEIYDVHGARVTTLLDATLAAGAYTVQWNGRDERGVSVGSGVYFGRMTSPAGVRSCKLTVVK